jgi:hypothetical protein
VRGGLSKPLKTKTRRNKKTHFLTERRIVGGFRVPGAIQSGFISNTNIINICTRK